MLLFTGLLLFGSWLRLLFVIGFVVYLLVIFGLTCFFEWIEGGFTPSFCLKVCMLILLVWCCLCFLGFCI